jgi:cytolysin-activating lysine-acyltransferase
MFFGKKKAEQTT